MKKQKNLSQSSRDKIEKMYQAVILLLDEGKDINSIKVSDITERAGIGKGTAYEYFESKEEIIANAMKYNMKKQTDSLYQLNEEIELFREKIMKTFSWIESNLKYRDSGIQFFKASVFSRDVSSPIIKAFHKNEDAACGLHMVINLQIEAAIREEIWDENRSQSLIELILISAYVEYFLYLSLEQEQRVEKEAMKEFIYQGILKRLSIQEESD
ncbi:MAG: TetR/AcrR family transcriptional regulator [Eubacteriales bacterium]|nr:TetR/AcrR family transcriptional regulator [Eubacteriales bacterium]